MIYVSLISTFKERFQGLGWTFPTSTVGKVIIKFNQSNGFRSKFYQSAAARPMKIDNIGSEILRIWDFQPSLISLGIKEWRGTFSLPEYFSINQCLMKVSLELGRRKALLAWGLIKSVWGGFHIWCPQNFRIFWPLPLSLSHISWFCFFRLLFGDPLLPPTEDVIYGSPLNVITHLMNILSTSTSVSGTMSRMYGK